MDNTAIAWELRQGTKRYLICVYRNCAIFGWGPANGTIQWKVATARTQAMASQAAGRKSEEKLLGGYLLTTHPRISDLGDVSAAVRRSLEARGANPDLLRAVESVLDSTAAPVN